MKPLFVVSGHPRSGTAACMRMLHFGGLSVLSDEKSMEGDKWNPLGGYEITNFQWAMDNPLLIQGSAIKIVSQYADVLEEFAVLNRLDLKVIFMVRPLRCIERSLRAMKMQWDPPPQESIALARKVIRRYKLECLDVEFEKLVEDTRPEAARIKQFVESHLNIDLDLDKMVEAIVPDMCHHWS